MTRKIFLGIHQIALGLLPVALCFWYYQTLFAHPIDKIYFTYTDGLLFTGDVLAVVAVLAWWLSKDFSPPHTQSSQRERKEDIFTTFPLLSVVKTGFAFCLLSTLSIFWSVDWRISLAGSLHLWLVFGLFLSIRDRPESWRAVAIGFCAALLVQVVIGFWEFGAQSTAFLAPLGMKWPGLLVPSVRGASIVELADGARWLRVYGTLPHPNLLGGFTLVFLAGPAAFFLLSNKRHLWALLLLAGGAALLILTFSRSAWVGLAATGLVLTFHHRKLNSKRLIAASLATLTGLVATVAPLYQLIFTRAGAGSLATEEFSNTGRIWLTGQALSIIRDHPLLGVGAETFIVEYARHAPYGYLIEPVHNLPLLVIAELGLPGAVIGLGLGTWVIRNTIRATHAETILFSALLIGLLVTSFFDHYLWTLAPGRMLFGLAFGLWAAQQNQEISHAANPL